jgi:hypothetical protein
VGPGNSPPVNKIPTKISGYAVDDKLSKNHGPKYSAQGLSVQP